VLVAAGAPDDPARGDGEAFLAAALAAEVPIHQPTLSLVELPAAIARRTGDTELAGEAAQALLAMPGLVLHPLDLEASADAASIAGRLLLRGVDAVYASTALRERATLVTLDDELRERASPVVDAVSPREWLERLA
jgi:predicted nucleic acid-binding protein